MMTDMKSTQQRFMKRIILAFIALILIIAVKAQTGLKKVYNVNINPIEQIDQAIIGVPGVYVLQTSSLMIPPSAK